jgi:glycosyltransferase involved in cell wall biosynthesis
VVIVVDNDSDDGTRGAAEALGARVMSHAEHSISAARNAGAAVPTGDLLVFIDADTLDEIERTARRVSELLHDVPIDHRRLDVGVPETLRDLTGGVVGKNPEANPRRPNH